MPINPPGAVPRSLFDGLVGRRSTAANQPEGRLLQYRSSLHARPPQPSDRPLMYSNLTTPWTDSAWQARTACLLNSYERWLGRSLIDSTGTPEEVARGLFEAPFVVVAHGTESDPILNFANRTALALWELDLATLLTVPSRQTAEPVHRDERARMLQRTREQGYIDDYTGIRITATGRRFRIAQAVVWNLVDADGNHAGQAATFAEWTWL